MNRNSSRACDSNRTLITFNYQSYKPIKQKGLLVILC